MTFFEELNTDELYFLAITALFDTRGTGAGRVRAAMQKLCGNDEVDLRSIIKTLRESNFVHAVNYNWRTDSYDYILTEQRLIPFMVYLYEKQPDVAVSVLKESKGLQPTPIQKMLWKYVSSGYRTLNAEDINDYEINNHLDYFQPGIADEHFAPMLLMFNNVNFYELLNNYITSAFANQLIIDERQLHKLIKNFRSAATNEHKLRLQCLTDLYAFLAEGKKPAELYAANKNHRIIAGIYEAYRRNYSKSLEHFKKALTLHNKNKTNFGAKKNYFALSIVNFFYVLVSLKCGTDEGNKKALGVVKGNTDPLTASARVLHNVLLNNATENQIKNRLAELYASGSPFDKVIAMLLSHYTGKNLTPDVDTRWLVMRQEMRKFKSLDQADEAVADKLFGTEGMLCSIYHKQEWESVLEDLMGLSGATSAAAADKSARIAYYLHDIRSNSVQVKQQTILKNGSWSAGKQVAMSSFIGGQVEGMTDSDRAIANAARREAFYSYDMSLAHVLPEMTEHSRLYVGTYAPYTLVEVTEEMPYITLAHDNTGYVITSNVPLEDIDSKVIVTHRGAASINFIRLNDSQRPYYRRLLSLGHFPDEAEEQLRAFLATIGGKIEVNSDLIEGGSTLPLIQGTSQLVLQMRPHDKESYAVGIFCRPKENGRIRCIPGAGNDIIVDGMGQERARIQRDMEAETDNLNHLIDSVSEQIPDASLLVGSGMTIIPYFDLLPVLDYAQQNPDRIICEWPEGAKLKIKQRQLSSTWNGSIKKTENGWFEIEGSVELDQGQVVTMSQLLDLASQSHGRFIKLGEGEFLALSDKLRQQLNSLSAIASRSRGKLQMSPFSAALLGPDVLEGELFLEQDEELKQIRQRIKESGNYSPRVPKTLNATLRTYQQEGYKWMARLNKWGAGALLADDMGLGKTIQTITLLLSKASEGPALVVAPASVAPNWKTEFEKFAPSLNIFMLNFADDRTKCIEDAKAGDVVVTTYGLLLSVKDDITEKHWNTICLDEAHIIKNRGAKTSAVAMQLHSDNRIMLTGTPVQNHLGELWNLFQFVNPGLLGSFEDFNRRFIVPIEQNRDKERQHELDRLVKPFMLRRTKDKVAKELPEKQEIYQHVDISEEEMLVYEALRQKAEAMLMAEEGGTISMNTLAEITRLRQCACDTRLVENVTDDLVSKKLKGKQGSKITALVELLQTILDGYDNGGSSETTSPLPSTGGDGGGSGASVLVFSQFTSYLALVKEALDAVHIPYLYIDGSIDIKQRTKLVKDFQDGKVPVFLISLKAGGLGLNLTRANYVIHMDPWWNPAIEAQATDRAHRIGQKQTVMVYHLIASGTIEEKIQRLHERKKALVENILESTDMSHKLTGAELLEMIR